MRDFPNSILTHSHPAEPEKVSNAIPVMLEDFAGLLTVVLVFLGISTICKSVWPDWENLTRYVTMIVFLAWFVLMCKLRVYRERERVGAKRFFRLYTLVASFVYFSVLLILLDLWNHEFRGARSLVMNSLAGFIFAFLVAKFDRDSKISGSSESA
jgi:peptidoglycan/LPS O-acetylase OafA/YrhL